MKGAAAALFIFIPAIARAAESTGQQFSFLASLLQMIAALALVIGLILVTWHFSGKLLGRLPAGSQFVAKHIRLIETRYISPKKSLMLVEVGGEYLLISSSESGLALVKHINMLEDIEVIEDSHPQNSFATLLTRFRQS